MVFQTVQQSAVMKPTATLGLISSGPSVSVSRLGSEHFVTTAVGSTFHVYDCDNLQLQYLSRPLLGPIRVVLNIGECTAVCCESEIMVFHKMSLLMKLVGHSEEVELLSHVGDSFLVSSSKSKVCVWKLPGVSKAFRPLEESLKPFHSLKLGFEVTAMLHVPTYLNKMLFGGIRGELELWNIHTGKLIHKFHSVSNCAITCLAASPAVDVVGLGHKDGSIQILNLALDEQLMVLTQKEHGAVTALSFRCDYAEGMLVTGSSDGDLVVWNLSKKQIHSVLPRVHPGGVSSVCFLGSLPLLLSSGLNALSIHIFDKPDGGGRLLKERRGFTSPVTGLMPYGEHDLICVATNEVGRINLIQSHQDKVWPQASALGSANSKKPWKFRNIHQLSRVVSFSHISSRLRHFDWPCVVTAHELLPDAYVWSPHQESLVTRQLIVPRKASTGARPPCLTQVAVSTCGNYAVVGCENGEIHRFNLQSCAYRGVVQAATNRPVVHLEFISARDVISADSDSIKIWKVIPRPEITATLSCVENIERICLYNFLCAVSHKDALFVSIVDLHADQLARRVAVTAPVTCMAWAEGGRWLAVATADARMIIYDVPTGAVVDRVEFASECLAVVFTHANTQIVTSHPNGGIRVWQNVALLNGPGVVSGESFVRIDQESIESPKPIESVAKKMKPTIASELSYSSLSRTRWQQILKLDEIKERNRPIRAAEKPKSAPFFLPVKYQGVEPVFAAEAEPNLNHFTEEVKIQNIEVDSGFQKLIVCKNFDKIRAHFLALSPAGVHICLSQLEDEVLEAFLEFLVFEAEDGRNIDLVATWTALVLRENIAMAHESVIKRLSVAFKKAHEKFETESNQLQCLLKVAAALQLHR